MTIANSAEDPREACIQEERFQGSFQEGLTKLKYLRSWVQ